mgnify:CR=1 FL=1
MNTSSLKTRISHLTLGVTLTERATGKTLYTRPNFEVRERYEISVDPSQYFEESDTALRVLAESIPGVEGVKTGFTSKAGRCLIAFRKVNRMGAKLTLLTAETVHQFHRQHAHQDAGFVSLADFAREILGLAPRTVRRRLALAPPLGR